MIPKDYTEFEATLTGSQPLPDWPEGLKALWYDAKGDWEASHNIAQDLYNQLGSWIHAYLHRKEGDRFNAGYWYRQANRPFSKLSLEDELKDIVEYVLQER
ncbi:hypothetical protein [Maribacter cobaltidurans]|uniref:Uncharacterized protein n=1 Tax=Maribacter cobaltidurans TaxID=1178778 RepID=A0A223V993_9FLAO|nr:hypothetical protein [Maribacter cobaltidurans]ASV31963.1 hypothetical protein CJ263_18045 [Maribacter cobaltidurans]GGD86058.1 hypothetical protein GCM10011412_24850 [Maribacter cobaltidurans]